MLGGLPLVMLSLEIELVALRISSRLLEWLSLNDKATLLQTLALTQILSTFVLLRRLHSPGWHFTLDQGFGWTEWKSGTEEIAVDIG